MKKLTKSYGFAVGLLTIASLVFSPLAFAAGTVTDYDGDGVLNYVDIDDDNDGILDTVENPYAKVAVQPSFFGLGDLDEAGGNFFDVTDADISSLWSLPSGSVTISITHAGTVLSPGGAIQWAVADGNDAEFTLGGSMIAELSLLHGSALADSGQYDGFVSLDGASFSPTHTLETGYSDLIAGNSYRVIADGSEDGTNTGSFTWDSNLDASSVRFSTDNTAVWGNAVVFSVTPLLDTDGDSVPDKYDLDSDNDGIADLVEAAPNGTLGANTNGQYTGSVDTDGLATSLATVPMTPADTDGDGKADFRDLDSDADGIPDAIEAQATAGYVDPAHTNNASNEGVNDSGLFVPVDTDSDGKPDYRDTDSDNDGTLDSAEIANPIVATYSNVDGGLTAAGLKNSVLGSTSEVDFREPNPATTLANTGTKLKGTAVAGMTLISAALFVAFKTTKRHYLLRGYNLHK